MSLKKVKAVCAASKQQCTEAFGDVQVGVVFMSNRRWNKNDMRIGKTNAVCKDFVVLKSSWCGTL